MFKKIGLAVAGLTAAGVASAASIVDYAALSTAVNSELSSGVAAAMVGVGLIWGARIGLNFVRSIMR